MDFGGQLGSKISPKLGQNQGKSMKDGLPNQWKFCMFFERPFSGSWGQHGSKILPKWCPGGLDFPPVFGLGRVLGESWGLLGLKRLQELILIDFWLIFDRFWLIFGGFLNDFSMISVMVVTRVWYRRSSWMFLIFFCMSASAWFSKEIEWFIIFLSFGRPWPSKINK